MTTKVSLMPLSDAVPGMILAADVRDGGGATLLAGGAELTPGMIASLQRRGVANIQIAEEETLTPEQLAARHADVVARVNAIFRRSMDDPLMAKLRDALLAYRLEGLE